MLILFLVVLVNIFCTNVNCEALNKDTEMVFVHKPQKQVKAGQNNNQQVQRQQYNVFGLLMVPS